MTEIHFDKENYDRYTIGFTEIQFIPSDTCSPTPSDHAIGYNSQALGHAERFNKGAENMFLDQSINLDKQRSKSVSKIHNNILDLVFELTERRKSTTPLLNKSLTGELPRVESRLSAVSSDSSTASSCMSLIEVQQLPHLQQSRYSFPDIDHESIGLPDINAHQAKKSKQNKIRKNSIINENLNNSAISRERRLLQTSVDAWKKTVKAKTKGNKALQSEKQSHNNTTIHRNDTDTKFSQHFKDVDFSTSKNSNREDIGSKRNAPSDYLSQWHSITTRLIEAQKLARENRHAFNEYRGRYLTPSSKNTLKMSFCQSSYNERAERERVKNISRRHASQVKVGPLDFNKLKRQITLERSKTTLF